LIATAAETGWEEKETDSDDEDAANRCADADARFGARGEVGGSLDYCRCLSGAC